MQRKNGIGVVTVIHPIILPGVEGRFVMYLAGKIRYDYSTPGTAPNVEISDIKHIANAPKIVFIPQQNVAGISYTETNW